MSLTILCLHSSVVTTLLLVPKSMNLKLIMRLFSFGPDWHALAVVVYRLASRAPWNQRRNFQGLTVSQSPVFQGSVMEKLLRSLKPISDRNTPPHKVHRPVEPLQHV